MKPFSKNKAIASTTSGFMVFLKSKIAFGL
jgi:hypothetical protein